MYLYTSQICNKCVPKFLKTKRVLFHKLYSLLNEMPKEKKHTQELQKQRQKLKEKGQKYVPGTVSLHVLGSGADGTAKSLYMFTDQSRYMFNVGEGSQRLAHEHKMKLSKLEHIFITNPVWENIGGLPGVALTIQDVGVPEITLHGPERTIEIFSATRRFVILKDLSIRMAPCFDGEFFEDTVMTVQYVPLRESRTEFERPDTSQQLPAATNGNQVENTSSSCYDDDDDIDYYAHERKRKKRPNSKDRSLSPDRKRPKLQKVVTSSAVMCYICRLKAKPGSLCLEKCVEKGVPPGPLLGRLKSGEDVQLIDGTVVRSTDVCLPDDPGPVFIVVDCPSLELLDTMISNPAFKKHQLGASKTEDFAYLVVHFTPPEVMEDIRYREWMEQFCPSTQHLVINSSNCCMGSVAVHRIQHKLHLLHEGIFPLLQDHSIPALDADSCASTDNPSSTNVPMVQGRTLCSIWLRPKRGVQRKGELTLDVKTFVEETLSEEGFPEELEKLQKLAAQQGRGGGPPQQFPQVLFLGTGSCIPNKTRNTSGILLQTSEDCHALVDCGEGTYGQLVRFFGPGEVDEVLRKIKAIYVSHLHADHHLGFIGVLKARRQACLRVKQALQPVYLIAPRQIMFWLNFYHHNFEPILEDFKLIANGDLINSASCSDTSPLLVQVLNALNMANISTVLVDHCPNAFGVAFTHRDGWKITYSGDTMPCAALQELGRDSDLLIHEATMEDELVEEAKLKLHSTTSQAIEVGRKMGARFTLLTHFSQRYAKLPRFNDNFAENVGIAFDNMKVGFADLSSLPLLYPSLKLMFAEHYEELEQKAARRILKRQREKAATMS